MLENPQVEPNSKSSQTKGTLKEQNGGILLILMDRNIVCSNWQWDSKVWDSRLFQRLPRKNL